MTHDTGSKRKFPAYGGIFLEPHQIKYEEIDPPLRRLIRLMNSQPWIRTYGSCAGHAHHRQPPEDEHQFFLGIFLEGGYGAANRLQSWVDEANRLNGSTGLRVGVESVLKHPFGQGSVAGWCAYRVAIHEIREGKVPRRPQIYLRMIKCLESAWKELWPESANPLL